MAPKLATATRNAELDAITTRVGASGLLKIYSGTQPADANTALSGNTLLSTLTLNATFAPASSGGVLTLNAITQDSSAAATGTATFARMYKADGTTVIGDFTVGTSGADINLNTTSIVTGGPVSCSSFTITAGNA
jgi:hypothetical protein